jgi:peroxiredoxin
MKKIVFILSVCVLAACNNSGKFIVEGVVDGGAGEMLYLEHTGLTKNIVIDSMKIKKDNSFKFKSKRPAYPDFYKIKIGSKQIHFSVDSTETIEITTSLEKLSSDYTITGSESNTDIQILRNSVAKLQNKANQLNSDMSSDESNAFYQEFTQLVEDHKNLAKPIILKNPRSTAAYFAIFQQVSNIYIFSPYIKEDRPFCAAVATAYHTYMPDYERSKNLYAWVMDAIKSEREAKQQSDWKKMMEENAIGFIDINLPDKDNQMRKLSDLVGKVILLDFSAFEARESVQYTFALRDLYNKYKSRGFEIYQVSLDRNKILWEDAVENLPWICVRDDNGPNTKVVTLYNISEIPTYFLINKKGDIVGRNFDLQALEKEISKAL